MEQLKTLGQFEKKLQLEKELKELTEKIRKKVREKVKVKEKEQQAVTVKESEGEMKGMKGSAVSQGQNE